MVTKQPDITFFGEDLPKTFHDRLVEHDRNLVDLVLIIGTSLKVAPVSEIPSFLPAGIPQLYVSREVSFTSLPPSLFPFSSPKLLSLSPRFTHADRRGKHYSLAPTLSST